MGSFMPVSGFDSLEQAPDGIDAQLEMDISNRIDSFAGDEMPD